MTASPVRRTISVSVRMRRSDPSSDAAEAGVLDRTGAERAHDHEVRTDLIDVGDQLFPVAPIARSSFERDLALEAPVAHHVRIALADQLEAGGDQRVVDASLAQQLRLVLVLVRERVLHLLEAVVVHARRIDVHADARGEKASASSSATVVPASECSELSSAT